jgi:hypothetical protein
MNVYLFSLAFCLIILIILNINKKEKFDRRDELSDFLLSIGVDKISHSGRSIYDHLLGTYDIIKKENGDEKIALIGGLHCVYGTYRFNHKTIDLDSGFVSDHFGDEIDTFVRKFGTMDRKKLEEFDQTIPEDELTILQWVEYANKKDMNHLYKIPNIVKKINL